LWPKKRGTVSKDNLSKLAKSFDTTEDPTLQLKGLSIKRGAEGAIALSLEHSTDFDWERVSPPYCYTRDEMKVFFEKAKKLAPPLLTMISPSAASAVPAAPPPAAKDPVPPSTSSEEAAAPPSTMEQNAEWHRLSFLVVFLSFLLLNVKTSIKCNPRILAIGLYSHVNISSSYEVLCYLSEIVSPFYSFVVDGCS
jgi:hypothetical protein